MRSSKTSRARQLTSVQKTSTPARKLLQFQEAINLHRQGRLQEARAICEALLRSQPSNLDALHMLAGIAYETADYKGTVEFTSQAITLSPQHFFLYYNRGMAFEKLQQFGAALQDFSHAIQLQPKFHDAYFSRANLLYELEQWNAAILDYDQSIDLQPEFFDAYSNRANALQKLERLDSAIDSLRKAISLKPDFAPAHCNLGNMLQASNQAETALACYDQAIRLQPDFVDAYYNRGNALVKLHHLDAAIQSFDTALQLKPNFSRAHFDKSFALLLKGDFVQGWPEYEWRWKTKEAEKELRNFDQPRWLGDETLPGKTILLHGEQGFGDMLQFCRYAKQVKALGARVLLEVPAPLVKLLKHLEGVDVVLEQGAALPEFDYHCPLMSLPLAFKTQLDTIPSAAGYLRIEEQKLQHWSARLGVKKQVRVGLVWSGSTTHTNDRNRSMALQTLLPHLPPACEYVCLQKELRDSDQAAFQNSGMRFFGAELHDFSDTAALCALMDVVISVDTSVAHVSAGLGKPTWVLLPYTPDWRWMLDRQDSPWYRSVRLYRQQADRQWDPVLAMVGLALSNWVASAPSEEEQKQIQALCQQGFVLHQQGKLEQAQEIYNHVLTKDPQHFDALHWSGVLAGQKKLPELALDLLSQALAVVPNHAEAHYNRGVALQDLKRLEEAVVSFDQAIKIKPDYADAYCNRGNTLQTLKRLEEAVASYDAAIQLKPDHAHVYCNRGNVLQELKRFDEALGSYNAAIQIKPDDADAYCNRGNALQALKRFDEALTSYDAAIQIKPDYANVYCNRGNVLQELKRFDEALASYDKAMQIKSDHAGAYWNKSLLLLLLGKFDAGWNLYEWRWMCEFLGLKQRNFRQPLWLGQESLEGRTILLHGEQGFGDMLQFCRYAKQVKALGARVLLEVSAPLVGLLKHLEGVDVVLEQGTALPEFDYHCPLMSLPLAFKTQLDTIPSAAGYLRIEEQKLQHWSARLGVKKQVRVGLVWSGSTIHKNDRNRSMALQTLLPHLPPACEYVCLQKELRDSDQAAFQNSGMRFFGAELHDFSDTAALCALMDVVISVDTSVAHVSAGLGKPTWVLLPYRPDWRWMLDRQDSPWYRSVRLYRQQADRQWGSVLSALRQQLSDLGA